MLKIDPIENYTGEFGQFRSSNDVASLLWIHPKDFFKILHIDWGKGAHENCINDFSKKKFVCGKLAISNKVCFLIQF